MHFPLHHLIYDVSPNSKLFRKSTMCDNFLAELIKESGFDLAAA
jgi:hypothetical protein